MKNYIFRHFKKFFFPVFRLTNDCKTKTYKKMYLKYFLNVSGDRVYTLKVGVLEILLELKSFAIN